MNTYRFAALLSLSLAFLCASCDSTPNQPSRTPGAEQSPNVGADGKTKPSPKTIPAGEQGKTKPSPKTIAPK